MDEREKLIAKIAEVAEAVAFGSGEPSIEMAGAIVSHLAAHPEHIPDFMEKGSSLLIDGEMTLTSGELSHRCRDGVIRSSAEIRALTRDRAHG